MQTLISAFRANISLTYFSFLVLKNYQMHYGASRVKYQSSATAVNFGPSVLVHKILILC